MIIIWENKGTLADNMHYIDVVGYGRKLSLT